MPIRFSLKGGREMKKTAKTVKTLKNLKRAALIFAAILLLTALVLISVGRKQAEASYGGATFVSAETKQNE